jgi:hypothetical protein
VRSPSRDAASNNSGIGVRRRRVQGCEIEKRQKQDAPCARALFIGPSAKLGILRCPVRLPAPHSNPKQRLDGYARVD